MSAKYAIGIDFGTESGRALLVDVADGRELATAVYSYSNGVIDEYLPGTNIRLEPDWALQDPNDYIEVVKRTVPAVLKESGVDPADVIGIGIDFTACTMLPTKADGTPLCQVPELRNYPHSWVKLWKHHAASPKPTVSTRWRARRPGWTIMAARFRRMVLQQALQILNEAPEIYRKADRMLEAADWVIWQLAGARRAIPARRATRPSTRRARAIRAATIRSAAPGLCRRGGRRR